MCVALGETNHSGELLRSKYCFRDLSQSIGAKQDVLTVNVTVKWIWCTENRTVVVLSACKRWKQLSGSNPSDETRSFLLRHTMGTHRRLFAGGQGRPLTSGFPERPRPTRAAASSAGAMPTCRRSRRSPTSSGRSLRPVPGSPMWCARASTCSISRNGNRSVARTAKHSRDPAGDGHGRGAPADRSGDARRDRGRRLSRRRRLPAVKTRL